MSWLNKLNPVVVVVVYLLLLLMLVVVVVVVVVVVGESTQNSVRPVAHGHQGLIMDRETDIKGPVWRRDKARKRLTSCLNRLDDTVFGRPENPTRDPWILKRRFV